MASKNDLRPTERYRPHSKVWMRQRWLWVLPGTSSGFSTCCSWLQKQQEAAAWQSMTLFRPVKARSSGSPGHWRLPTLPNPVAETTFSDVEARMCRKKVQKQAGGGGGGARHELTLSASSSIPSQSNGEEMDDFLLHSAAFEQATDMAGVEHVDCL